jgi:hypothetical protein
MFTLFNRRGGDFVSTASRKRCRFQIIFELYTRIKAIIDRRGTLEDYHIYPSHVKHIALNSFWCARPNTFQEKGGTELLLV